MTTSTHARADRARLPSVLLAGTALSILAAPVQAQEQSEPYRLGTVTVDGQARPDVGYRASATSSATKTPTALIDTPQAVSVVTRQQIDDQALISMNDVVRYVPGAAGQCGGPRPRRDAAHG